MKARHLLIIAVAAVLTACTRQATTQHDELSMLVGTYTDGESEGIYSFSFDQQTGLATSLDTLAMVNPSYLTIAADGCHVYAVSETSDSTASVSALSFDAKTGHLALLNTAFTKGKDPCFVEENGQLVLTANYSGGSMSVFQTDSEGRLMPLAQQFQGSVGGPDQERQATPHVHCAHFTPDGKYILATDFSADRILTFRVEGLQVSSDTVAADVERDSGPRHLAFSNDGHFAYLMSELSGRVTAFQYANGRLTEIQHIESDTVGARGGADIHLSPDGRFLYSSNRLKADGIAIFAIDQQTGLLTKVGYQPTGSHPRHFNLTPNGRYLLCACRDSDVIQVFLRDTKTGLLTDTHQDIRVSKPVCIQFFQP